MVANKGDGREEDLTEQPQGVSEQDIPERDAAQEEEPDHVQLRLEQLEQQYQDVSQKWLRCQADFDNFRKRQQRRLEEAEKYGNQSLLCDLLVPLDNFERALSASQGETVDVDALRTGIALVSSQLLGVLADKWGLKKIEALQQPYDANLHQAVTFIETEECQAETVLEEFQTGYLLHDRVIRPAMVKVGKPLTACNGKSEVDDSTEENSAPGGELKQ